MSEANHKKSVLRATDLRHSFGKGETRTQVLDGISLEVSSGEVCSIVGPSGCGKSTLLYLLGLLDHPDSGEVLLAGQPVSGISQTERSAMRNKML